MRFTFPSIVLLNFLVLLYFTLTQHNMDFLTSVHDLNVQQNELMKAVLVFFNGIRLEIMGVHDVRWEKIGTEPADDYTFL
jgi:hypothetical protein